jgi:hypothetical protein
MALKMGLSGFLKAMAPDLGLALRRFPVAVAIAAIFTLLHLFDLNDAMGLNSEQALRLSVCLGCGFLWAFAAGLYSERLTMTWAGRLGIVAAGLILIALAFWFSVALALQPYILGLALFICVGLAPYLGDWRRQVNAAFWQFNHRLWLGAGLALVGAVLFAGGLSAIIETIELLFDADFPSVTHEKIWTVGLGFVAPVNWLTLAPETFDDKVEEGEQSDFTARAIATIVKYILAPLLLVYTAILYAYAVKIAIDGALPKGRVGPLVLGYGAVGTLSVLLAYPVRAHGGPLVAALWRHWFWLTLVPAALLFLAAYQRIAQYGLTDDRYLVVLFGVWLVSLSAIYLIFRTDRDLRTAPLVLALLLAISSFGPWGALGLSVRSQMDELAQILTGEGRLVDGRIASGADKPLSQTALQRVRSIVAYLRRAGQIVALRPLFAGAESDPFAERGATQRAQAAALLKLLGADAVPRPVRKDGLSFAAQEAGELAIGEFDRIAGPVSFAVSEREKEQVFNFADPTGDLRVAISRSQISVSRAGGPAVVFKITGTVELFAVSIGSGDADTPHKPIVLRESNDQLAVGLMIENFNGRIVEGAFERLSGRIWVLTGERKD